MSDPAISDHMLLSWTLPVAKPITEYSAVTYRAWNRGDVDELRSFVSDSPLCDADYWPDLDVNELSSLFDSTLCSILDSLAPQRSIKRRRRPSDPWYDAECRLLKRSVRRLERRCHHLCSFLPSSECSVLIRAIEAVQLWKSTIRAYHSLLRSKRQLFWRDKVASEQASPRALWKSVNSLMGRGSSISSTLSAQELHDFFDGKVANVRHATDNSASSSFLHESRSCDMHSFTLVNPCSVLKAILRLPNNFYASDPMPIKLKGLCTPSSPFCSFCFQSLPLQWCLPIFVEVYNHYSNHEDWPERLIVNFFISSDCKATFSVQALGEDCLCSVAFLSRCP